MAPQITDQVRSANLYTDNKYTLWVAATDPLPLTYEWKKDGNIISTDETVLITASSTSGGVYMCTVRNPSSETITEDITLTTIDRPTERATTVVAGDKLKKTLIAEHQFTVGFETDSNEFLDRRGVESIGIKFVNTSDPGYPDMKHYLENGLIVFDEDLKSTI